MGEISRFGVSAEDDLLESYDQLIATQGYTNRSEALRDLMRDALIKSRVDNVPDDVEVLGSLTLIYDHHASELTDKMAELQHDHHGLVISVMHVHISHDDCMEMIVLRGNAKEIRSLSGSLLSLKGVKHGQLFMTLQVQEITGRQSKVSKSQKLKHNHAQSSKQHRPPLKSAPKS
jgi:CopG family nickel-responsive transcriptional regulator